MIQQYLLSIHIDTDTVQTYYQGRLSGVRVQADSGEFVQIPLRFFRPYMSQLGVRGRFRLSTDENGKFISLEKMN